MQTLVAGLAASIRTTGTMTNPLGDAGISLVDCADIGESAATALIASAFDGGTYTLTGPQALTYQQLGRAIGDSIGFAVEVIAVTPEQTEAAMLANGATAWEAAHLREMLTLFRAGQSAYVTDGVGTLTRHRPRSVSDFLIDHRADFIPA
jgi:uncharacterized protein YbjT (DUF2867 family)